MAYNDDNDLLFTIREYAGDIVKNRSSNQNRILQVHSKKLRKQINLINVIVI